VANHSLDNSTPQSIQPLAHSIIDVKSIKIKLMDIRLIFRKLANGVNPFCYAVQQTSFRDQQ
jgi:hypothetical protein